MYIHLSITFNGRLVAEKLLNIDHTVHRYLYAYSIGQKFTNIDLELYYLCFFIIVFHSST